MKSVTATQLRQDLFRVLDDVVAGETVVVERKGHHVMIVLAQPQGDETSAERPDYRDLVSATDLDDADLWTWEWDGEGVHPVVDPSLRSA